jgi:hypothetical protein
VVVAQEGIIWEIINPQAIPKSINMVSKQTIMRVIISKAILSHPHKSSSKRILNHSFHLEKHQCLGSLQYSILILTKVMQTIIKEVILHKGKVLEVQLVTKRFSREKKVAQKMKGHQILSIRKLITMVTSLKGHGRIMIHRFKVSH